MIPPSGKVVGAPEMQLMVDASLDAWLTTGRFNTLFESRLAGYLGVKHLMTVNSGSSANLVAFSTLTSPKLGDRAIKPGDEVIGVLPHDGESDPAVRRSPGVRRRAHPNLQHRCRSARGRHWPAHQGDHAGAHAGQSVQPEGRQGCL
ncbi:DegT/DnrJ/EryC1/StrS aminotransferase family protein [compost metagenome]